MSGSSERTNVKKLMGPLGGSSERANVISQRAIIDSGADLHILNLQDAMKLFSKLHISKLDVIGVNGKTTRAGRQGSLVGVLNGPEGNEYNLDLGTAHALESCPVNLLSMSRLVDIGAVLSFEKNKCRIQPPARLQSHGGRACFEGATQASECSRNYRWF